MEKQSGSDNVRAALRVSLFPRYAVNPYASQR